MVSDTISRVMILRIGTVLAEGNSFFRKPCLNFLPSHAKKRTDNFPVDRTDSGCPGKPGSPEQMKQHGLCSVVAVMCYSNPALSFAKHSLKCLIADQASLLLLGNPGLLRPFPHLLFHQIKGQLIAGAERFHETRVLSCILPDSMIDMHHFKLKGNLLLHFKQYKKEADRICAS